MKLQLTHNKLFIALALSLCVFFCGHVFSKHYSVSSQTSINLADEKDAEQKEEVKETAEFFVSPFFTAFSLNTKISLDKPMVGHQHICYDHYVSPETPPPNC